LDWHHFHVPDRSFDVRYRVQFDAGFVELLAQLPILVERRLQPLGVLVVALRGGDLRGSLEFRCFGIENSLCSTSFSSTSASTRSSGSSALSFASTSFKSR